LTTELYSEFNLNTNTEIPTNKSEFTYNTNGDRTSTDYSNWNGTSYITGQRINYTFNTNNQLTDVLTLMYNQLIMNLLPITKETYEYDANGLLTAYEVCQNFSIDLSKYQTGARTEYRCTNVATTSLISKSTNKIKIYPNPATTILNIEGLKINSTIQILNAKGKVILSKVIEDENTTVDVSELSNGIYFIHFSNNQSVLRN
jgi:hypothetical protein